MSEKLEDVSIKHNHRCSTIPCANATVSVNSENDRLQSNKNHVTAGGPLAEWRWRNEQPSCRRNSGDDLRKSSGGQVTRTTTRTTCRRCCLYSPSPLIEHTITAAVDDVATSAIRIAVSPTALLYLFIALLYCCCCCGYGCSAATVLRRDEPQRRQQELLDVEPQNAYVQASSPPLTYMALRRNSLLLAAPALLLASQQQQQQQQERNTAFTSKSGSSNALNALRIPLPPPSLSGREAARPDEEDSTPNRPFITSPFQHRPFFFGLMAPSTIVPTRTLLDQLKANAKALSDRNDNPKADVVGKVEKRRLVVRVPFAQNPDNMQLSRIYKSLFTQQKQKKRPSMDDTYRYVGGGENTNNNMDDGRLLNRKV